MALHAVNSNGRAVPVERKRKVCAPRPAAKKTAANVTTLVVQNDAYGDDRFKRSETVSMSFEEWDDIPSNPRQRNEEVRIAHGRADHLLRPNQKHREVAMAQLPDGRAYKVDGHTRSALWRSGRMRPPSLLLVDVYDCQDEQALMDLYDLFDNTGAVELGTERVTGAYRESGINPTSPMLTEGGISTAMRELYEFVNQVGVTRNTKNAVINRAVKMFSDEIMLLDKIKPQRDAFPYGIVMGALLTFAKHGDKALRFWELYAADSGNKSDNTVDAVEALVQRRKENRGKGNSALGRLMMNYAVKAYEHHAKGKTFSSKHLIVAMHKDKIRKYADDIRLAKGQPVKGGR